MARQIAPGTPTEIKAKQYDVKMPDWSIFDKLGDMQIKAANENFKLYAEALVTSESNKLYNQFKNDPINLANALGKLPEMLKGLPQEIQMQMNRKMYLNGVSLIERAQKNEQKKIEEENKANASLIAQNAGQTIANDYFNVLANISSPEDQRRPIDVETYARNRISLAELADLKDAEGNNVFNEKQRSMMKMPSEAILEGFRQFIYRPELEQLQEWGETVFANRDKFIKDTAIDNKTYDSMETMYKNRIKALQDDKIRKIHGQAFYDAAELITQPIQDNIDKAKTDGVISPRVIDKLVKASKEATATTYVYDPTKQTSPGAFLNGLNAFSEAIKNNDWSPEGREKALSQAADALKELDYLSKINNLSPELTEKIRATITKAITDKNANQNLGFLNDIQAKINQPTSDYAKIGAGLLQNSAFQNSKEIASKNYEQNVIAAMDYYFAGDMDSFQQALYSSDIQYKRDLVGFMPFLPYQWNLWEKDVENGKDVVIEYMGNQYRFNGFSAQKPLTLINLL